MTNVITGHKNKIDALIKTLDSKTMNHAERYDLNSEINYYGIKLQECEDAETEILEQGK